MSETAALSAFISGTSYDDLPGEVADRSKWAMCDYLAGAYGGSRERDGQLIVDHVAEVMPGSAATVLGNGTSSVAGALFANGAFPLVIGAGDTFESVVIHPSPPVVAPILTLAEVETVSGEDAITAYAVGLEVSFRLGLATFPSHYTYWHATGTIGVFGAAAAAASILDLPAETVTHVLGTAASFSAGLKKNLTDRVRPLHTGHAAQMGVQSALVARDGLTAHEEILEGDIGFGAATSDDYDPEKLTTPGERWGVMDTMLKPFPSGFITHGAMEALRTIVVEEDLAPGDVERIEVDLDSAVEYLFQGPPETADEGSLSVEYCLALILNERQAGLEEFSEAYFDTGRAQAQMDKVEVTFADDLFGDEGAPHGARVRVVTADGRSFAAEQPFAPGGASNPLSESRLERKFFDYAVPSIDEATASEVFEAMMSLEERDDLEPLVGQLGG